MKYFIELFTPTQAWLDLSKQERAAYLNHVNDFSKGLMDQGVVIVSMSENDQDTLHRAEYDFFVIWTIPTDELANAVQELMAGSDWFTYFDQLNLKGDSTDIFEKLINL
ncbi:DUF6616 family protein [Mucilaginibacter polytrichastri]|uniref:Uncharacterized protein n=1 Tax=Mucilaginibacter polytrichastri TaxID=1302689 RepID=A0A1Q5ZVC3_9SPHI|nr:DUF6616 family protein [Mucilaginibacter polytrichastri]OKS85729.1 hypothetical protein RG47T_1175 [Mucilaginibacter polytrichastri]SFS61806.1 hypothetical protein SAMN04487890_102399 [Mucilaginibacter polytrichastri]